MLQLLKVKILQDVLFQIAVIALQALGPSFNLITYLFLAVIALRSRIWAIKSLSLLVLLTFLNTALFHAHHLNLMIRWLVLFCAMIKAYEYTIKNPMPLQLWHIYFFIFIIVSFVSSLIYSYALFVSIAKLSVFGLVFFGTYLLFRNIETEKLERWFIAIICTVLLLSFPLIFSKYGYVRNGTGFQGIMQQPNGFGIYLAPLASLVLMQALFEKKKREQKIYLILSLVSLTYIILSLSRTSILALLSGYAFLGIISPVKGNRRIKKYFKIFSQIMLLILCMSWYTLDYVKNSPIESTISKYFLKGEKRDKKERNLLMSRQQLAEESLQGFMESPLIGIGFGLPNQKKRLSVKYDDVTGLPMSGSAEKGVLIMALLEETGIVGTIIFTMFIVFLMRIFFLKQHKIYYISIFIAAIFLNFGEMVFFSPGGFGTHVYLMIFLARKLAVKRENIVSKKQPVYYTPAKLYI